MSSTRSDADPVSGRHRAAGPGSGPRCRPAPWEGARRCEGWGSCVTPCVTEPNTCSGTSRTHLPARRLALTAGPRAGRCSGRGAGTSGALPGVGGKSGCQGASCCSSAATCLASGLCQPPRCKLTSPGLPRTRLSREPVPLLVLPEEQDANKPSENGSPRLRFWGNVLENPGPMEEAETVSRVPPPWGFSSAPGPPRGLRSGCQDPVFPGRLQRRSVIWFKNQNPQACV